jgi:hypothetical protein
MTAFGRCIQVQAFGMILGAQETSLSRPVFTS